MKSETLKKVQIKVIDDISDSIKWEHVAYVDRDLYDVFLHDMGCSRAEFANYIAKWVKQDFNYTITMAHRNDIEVAKALVKKRYQKAYPELFVDSPTDRQGWMRMWLNKKMKDELKYYGKK